MSTQAEICTVERNQLFYNQYEFSLNFFCPEVGRCRGLSHESLDQRLAYIANFRDKRQITSDARNNLHDLCEILISMQGRVKPVFYSHWLYVYANDLADIEPFCNLMFTKHVRIHQAKVTMNRDCVYLKNPQFQYRTYFKDRSLNQDQGPVLKRFLTSRDGYFGYSRGFRSRLNNTKYPFFYINSYNYIDHNHMQDLLLLQTVCPGIVRRTVTIHAK